MAQTFDVCIRGSAIVGCTLALLLARERLRVALVGPAEDCTPATASPDVRAYALNAASRGLLQQLRVWPEPQQATAVLRMQIDGDQGGCVHFDAAEQRVDALAWIVDVPALESNLAQAVRYQPQIERLTEPVPATLTAICEGRASRTRAQWGVEFDTSAYHQRAIAARVRGEYAHGQVARQWFAPDGSILALLPMGGPEGHSAAMVWSVPQEQAASLLALDAPAFAQRVQDASGYAIGALELISERTAWPLQRAMARQWCGRVQGHDAEHWVLAGDAAHNVHPLAGQGLNLGLADVQALADTLHARPDWRSVADMRLLRRYERQRKAALTPMGLAMDGLQQIFARPEASMQQLRNWGLNSFEQSHLLKQWAARQAMGL